MTDVNVFLQSQQRDFYAFSSSQEGKNHVTVMSKTFADEGFLDPDAWHNFWSWPRLNRQTISPASMADYLRGTFGNIHAVEFRISNSGAYSFGSMEGYAQEVSKYLRVKIIGYTGQNISIPPDLHEGLHNTDSVAITDGATLENLAPILAQNPEARPRHFYDGFPVTAERAEARPFHRAFASASSGAQGDAASIPAVATPHSSRIGSRNIRTSNRRLRPVADDVAVDDVYLRSALVGLL